MSLDNFDTPFKAAILLIAIATLYFIPAFVAWLRNHRNRLAITILNVLLGWTLLGWVVALVWPSPPMWR